MYQSGYFNFELCLGVAKDGKSLLCIKTDSPCYDDSVNSLYFSYIHFFKATPVAVPTRFGDEAQEIFKNSYNCFLRHKCFRINKTEYALDCQACDDVTIEDFKSFFGSKEDVQAILDFVKSYRDLVIADREEASAAKVEFTKVMEAVCSIALDLRKEVKQLI